MPSADPILEVKLMMDLGDFRAKIREFYLPCLVHQKKNSQYVWEVLAKDYAYISTPSSAITLRFKFYYKENDHWIEENSSNILEISKSEVPAQIIEMLEKSPKNKKVEVVDFIEEELKKFRTSNKTEKEE